MNPTSYRVVRHDGNGEIWILRVEADVLTGASGPFRKGEIPRAVAELDYDDHPDDLEWIVRAWEHFELVVPR